MFECGLAQLSSMDQLHVRPYLHVTSLLDAMEDSKSVLLSITILQSHQLNNGAIFSHTACILQSVDEAMCTMQALLDGQLIGTDHHLKRKLYSRIQVGSTCRELLSCAETLLPVLAATSIVQRLFCQYLLLVSLS